MVAASYSATKRLLESEKRKTKAERDTLLPSISRLSDLLWLGWNNVSGPNPERLRYIASDFIDNKETEPIMRYLFLKDKDQANSVVWPGLSYAGDSDEGKALLATPNGRITAWLLIDHAHQLNWRLMSRQLKVYIFAYAGKYCMLWDLEPQNPHRRISHRDLSQGHDERHEHVAKHPIGGLVKRGPKAEFDAAKNKGDQVSKVIQAAQDGCAKPVQDFDSEALNNGWTWHAGTKKLPGAI